MIGETTALGLSALMAIAHLFAGVSLPANHGLRPIESIVAGDLVWAMDPDTGEEDWQRVLETFVHPDAVLELAIEDGTSTEVLTVTGAHPTETTMSTLSDLQAWYAAHCDGDWEHARGIRVETIDNPGWMIRVDLAGTELEHRPFEAIAIALDADAWMDARVVGGVWQAACGPRGLDGAIETFLRWAHQAPR